jgi:YjbE family integral membrane protein
LLGFLSAIGGIVLVDLALSGDNALVIGAAAASLPRPQQRLAILFGGAGAIALRILLGVAATLLLVLPLLQAIGGAVLLVVAARLLAGSHEHAEPGASQAGGGAGKASARGFAPALLTILVADVTMSLDNVLAVGALAAGNLPLLAAGLLLSMGLLLVGSAVVARLIGRLPWLLDLAALVLGWTAGHMIVADARLGSVFVSLPWSNIWVPAVCTGAVAVADVVLRVRAARRARDTQRTA